MTRPDYGGVTVLHPRLIHVTVAFAMAAVAVHAGAQGRATFAGMTCTQLTEDQLGEVEEAYGEPCGVYVAAVAPESLAGKTGVAAGDILISVRMPDETEYYPIPSGIEDMIEFAKEAQPNDKIRLLLLRKEQGKYEQVKCVLGTPIGEGAAPEGDREDEEELEGHVIATEAFSFVSEEPEKILATALDGSELRQFDVDIFGGLMAWSFGTRLNERQKGTIREALIAFWKQANADFVARFDQGVRAMPDLIPKLTPEQREQIRAAAANIFVTMAQSLPGHPLRQVIMEVSGSARQALAGAGTAAELTQQDVDALLEYLCFQNQVITGQPVAITPEQYQQFGIRMLAYFEQASDEEKQMLANMDVLWAQMRVAWAQAQQAQQQAQVQRWRQAYEQQAATGHSPYISGWQGAPTGGGMDEGSFNAVMKVLNTTHEASMHALGAIDGGHDTSVYDSAGNWLYDY